MVIPFHRGSFPLQTLLPCTGHRWTSKLALSLCPLALLLALSVAGTQAHGRRGRSVCGDETRLFHPTRRPSERTEPSDQQRRPIFSSCLINARKHTFLLIQTPFFTLLSCYFARTLVTHCTLPPRHHDRFTERKCSSSQAATDRAS